MERRSEVGRVRLDEDCVSRAYEGRKPMDAMIRQPNVFGPKLDPPTGANLQTEFSTSSVVGLRRTGPGSASLTVGRRVIHTRAERPCDLTEFDREGSRLRPFREHPTKSARKGSSVIGSTGSGLRFGAFAHLE